MTLVLLDYLKYIYIFFLVHFCETGVGVSIASPVQPLERNQPCLSNLHTMKLEQQLKTC